MKKVTAVMLAFVLLIGTVPAMAAGKLSTTKENFWVINSYWTYAYAYAKVENVGNKPISVNAGVLAKQMIQAPLCAYLLNQGFLWGNPMAGGPRTTCMLPSPTTLKMLFIIFLRSLRYWMTKVISYILGMTHYMVLMD